MNLSYIYFEVTKPIDFLCWTNWGER